MVAVGQIWEYRKSSEKRWSVPNELLYKEEAVFSAKIAWQIVSGTIRGDDFYWTAKIIRDTDGFLNNTVHEFAEKIFYSNEIFRLIYDPEQVSGVHCTRCLRFYPYANWRSNFECWGCRNGY